MLLIRIFFRPFLLLFILCVWLNLLSKPTIGAKKWYRETTTPTQSSKYDKPEPKIGSSQPHSSKDDKSELNTSSSQPHSSKDGKPELNTSSSQPHSSKDDKPELNTSSSQPHSSKDDKPELNTSSSQPHSSKDDKSELNTSSSQPHSSKDDKPELNTSSSQPHSSKDDKPELNTSSSQPHSSKDDKPELNTSSSQPHSSKDDKPELNTSSSQPHSSKDDKPELNTSSSQPHSSKDDKPELNTNSKKSQKSSKYAISKLKMALDRLLRFSKNDKPELNIGSSQPQSSKDGKPELNTSLNKSLQSPKDDQSDLNIVTSKPQSSKDEKPKLNIVWITPLQSPTNDESELGSCVQFHCPKDDKSGLNTSLHRLPRSPKKYELSIGFVLKHYTSEMLSIIHKLIEYKSSTLQILDFDLNILANVINTADIFKISRILCHQISRGIIVIFGVVPPESYPAFHPYTNQFNIPFLTPLNPVIRRSVYNDELTIFMKPEYTDAVIDLLNHYNWGPIIYIFTPGEGIFQLQAIRQKRIPNREKFTVDLSYEVSNATEAIEFLVKIEEQNRYAKKFVVLDCNTEFATEVLKKHVNEVRLGRRNYHYLLTAFALDNIEQADIKDFGAINITGFALLDKSQESVKEALKLANRDSISAELALLYDSIEIFVEATLNVAHSMPGFIDASKRRNITENDFITDCNVMVPFKLGRNFLNHIKKAEINGITGFVGFNDKGERRNFTLQVMQINYGRKKLEKIGTWQEGKGLRMIDGKGIKPQKYGEFDRTKKYIITTIIEYPYLFSEPDKDDPERSKLTGFCRDLAELVMYKLELNYEIKVVKDGRYGNRNEKSISGWDGMIGEILRREADMVVAPLTVRSDRQEVVHFSQPFLSFLKKDIENPKWESYDIFFFIRSFSATVWCIFVLSLLGFLVCLLLIQYITRPRNRRRPSIHKRLQAANTNSEVATRGEGRRTRPKQGPKFWINVWFVISALFQQGREPLPPSFAEGTAKATLWAFIHFMMSTYVSSLTYYFAERHVSVQPHSYIMTTVCTKDSFRIPIESGEDTDAHLKFIPGVIEEDEICELILSSTKPGIKAFGIALDKGSQLRTPVDLALQTLKEEGEIERLIRQWFWQINLIPPIYHDPRPLSLESALGIFMTLVIGLLLSLCIAKFENFWYKRNDSNNETAFELTNELENQETAEDFKCPPILHDTPHKDDSIVTLEVEPDEQYGVPLSRNERPYSVSYQRKASSTKCQKVARSSLNQVTSDDELSATRTRKRKTKFHEHCDT